jgi:hypothetical protein
MAPFAKKIEKSPGHRRSGIRAEARRAPKIVKTR